ncbi:hypothetical protein [Spiroplasma alleghenense]|uniref:Uncharacterized protein n=1 Tax=Spiroplasma alleghenense TaxID=216931 RepID=A0A345Z2M9_9MOLU|nr:hypothetical protein [Spiroplasma alleghenense]AXK50858.1 hypothetical protein SALLE_v1c01820 [Spiroplasma alleghenense]
MKIFLNLLASVTLTGNCASGAIFSSNERNLLGNYEQHALFENSVEVADSDEFYQSIEESGSEDYKEEINYSDHKVGKFNRLYIDSGKDQNLPYKSDAVDTKYKKVEKNKVYSISYQIGYFNIFDYSQNKEDFLLNYSTIKVDYDMGYNLWNGQNGWTRNIEKKKDVIGKDFPLDEYEDYVEIKSQSNYTQLHLFSDKKHSRKETVEVGLEQFWDNNILKINIRLSAWVKWAAGSAWNHAAIIGAKNESTMIYKRGDKRIEHETIITNSTLFSPIKNNATLDLASWSVKNISDKILNKKRNSNYSEAKVHLLTIGYFGVISGGASAGTSSIFLDPSLTYLVVDAMNEYISKNSNRDLEFKLTLKFIVTFSTFYGQVKLKINDDSFIALASNVQPYRKGMSVTYNGGYTAPVTYRDR